MGTRSLTCVTLDGEFKVAQYGQCDGYPSYTGIRILRFLRDTDLDKLKNAVSRLRFMTEEELERFYIEEETYSKQLTPEQYDLIRRDNQDRCCNPCESADMKYLEKPFVQINRDLGWKVLKYIMGSDVQPLVNDVKFAGNSLSCEWAYVVDLDNGRFEIFKGLNKEPLAEDERFYSFEGYKDFAPVKLVVAFDLSDLPTEEHFLECCPDA